VISPLLANLYLHYAFDSWMQRCYPAVPFERYADDIVCHCHRFAELLSLLPTLFGTQVFRLSFDDIQFTDGRNKLRRQ
jgi:hypothetical protein